MYQFTIANQIIPHLRIDTIADAPSLHEIKLTLAASGAPYNPDACGSFRQYLQSSYDVQHTSNPDGSQSFVLKPLAESWTSSKAEFVHNFVQQISAYYSVSSRTILGQCGDPALQNDKFIDRVRADVKGKLTITDKAEDACIEIQIDACASQTAFCSWLEHLYKAARDEKDGTVTLRLERLKGTNDKLGNPTHLVYLLRGMMDAWDFRRGELVDAVQPDKTRRFVNALLRMRPHPLVAQELRDQIYGIQAVVVGAGFTGSSIVYQIAKKLIEEPPSLPAHITIIERHPEQFAGGLAYAAAGPEHRVNVQAQYLSLDPDNPRDFVEWLQKAGHVPHEGDAHFLDIPESLIVPATDIAHAAVQRQLYHRYLLDRVDGAVMEAQERGVLDVEIIASEARSADVEPGTDGGLGKVKVHLANGETAQGNVLVLANGHGPVVAPHFLADAYNEFPERIVIDQWGERERVEKLLADPSIKDVVVLGTGLSAMDIMMTAYKLGFFEDPSRTLRLVSRGGHVHPVLMAGEDYHQPEVDMSKYEGLIPHKSEDVPAYVERIFEDTKNSGSEKIGRVYTDEETFFALVPHIPHFMDIAKIPESELVGLHQKYSSLITRTAVAMAPEIGHEFHAYRKTGQIQITSADTKTITRQGEKLKMVPEKGDPILADAIISALPPQSDPKRVPLILDLMEKGCVRNCPGTGIGLDVTDGFRAIDRDGTVSNCVFISGPIVSGHVMEKKGLIGPLAQIVSGLRPEATEVARQVAEKCYEDCRPRVGIVVNLKGPYNRFLSPRWLDALNDLGLQPYLIDPSKVSPQHLDRILDNIDGIMLPGRNANVDPSLYGETPIPKQIFDRERDIISLALINQARTRKIPMPVFGICGGMEEINLAYGGKLDQALGGGHNFGLLHPAHMAEIVHNVVVQPGGRFEALYGTGAVFGVNSIHEQGILEDLLGKGLHAEAFATETTKNKRVVEALSDLRLPFMCGVQYHPEFDPFTWPHLPLVKSFVAAVKSYHAEMRRAPQAVQSGPEHPSHDHELVLA